MAALLQKLAGLDLGPAETSAIIEAEATLKKMAAFLYEGALAGAIASPFAERGTELLARLRAAGVPVPATVVETVSKTHPEPVVPPRVVDAVPVEVPQPAAAVVDTAPRSAPEEDEQPELTTEQGYFIQLLIDRLNDDQVLDEQIGRYVETAGPPWVPSAAGVKRTIGQLSVWVGRDERGQLMAHTIHATHGIVKRIPLDLQARRRAAQTVKT